MQARVAALRARHNGLSGRFREMFFKHKVGVKRYWGGIVTLTAYPRCIICAPKYSIDQIKIVLKKHHINGIRILKHDLAKLIHINF